MTKILLYGPRKGGTTLLQRLLDGGQEIFVHPRETKIKFFSEINNLSSETVSDIDHSRNFPAFRGDFDIDKVGFNLQAYQKYILNNISELNLSKFVLSDVNAAAQAYGYDLDLFSGWAIKDVGGDPKEIIESFLTHFPEGKVISLLRDPRYTARAVYTDRKRRGIKISLKKTLIEALMPYRITTYQLRSLQKYNVLPIYYENLAKNTEYEMRKVSDFLKISFNPIFLFPTMNGHQTIVKTSSKKTSKVFYCQPSLYSDVKYYEYLCIKFASIVNRKTILQYRSELSR